MHENLFAVIANDEANPFVPSNHFTVPCSMSWADSMFCERAFADAPGFDVAAVFWAGFPLRFLPAFVSEPAPVSLPAAPGQGRGHAQGPVAEHDGQEGRGGGYGERAGQGIPPDAAATPATANATSTAISTLPGMDMVLLNVSRVY